MAAARFLLAGEHLGCAICLDVVTDPVTTPCGHNFCKECIEHCWDIRVIAQCPLCNARFTTRPQMKVNTVLKELAIEHKKWAQILANHSAHNILCDICSARKDLAVVSCFVCLTSFCETHMEPHLRVAGLRGHTLSAPVSGLEDRLCKIHHRLINRYCKTDQACICDGCVTTNHNNHHIVLLETECSSKLAEVHRAIDARSRRLCELKLFIKTRVRGVTKQVICSRPDLTNVAMDRCRAAEQQVKGFIAELNMEITELNKKRDDLEHHQGLDDHYRLVEHHRLVLTLSSLPALLNKDLNFNLPNIDCIKRCTAPLVEVTLQQLKDCAVDVTLDPDTAHCDLIVSPDGKAVMLGATPQDVPNSRNRFKHHAVLSKEGFRSGRFYFEVQVKGKTSWTVGVASESLNRKYPASMSVRNECWVIALDAGRYRVYGPLSSAFNGLVKEKPQAVGVFVDYDAGRVSFYNVDGKNLIYTFSGQRFYGRLLHPYLCTRSDRSPSDLKPLTITA